MAKRNPVITVHPDHYMIGGVRHARTTSIISHFSGGYEHIDPAVLAEAAHRGKMCHDVQKAYLDGKGKLEAIKADMLSRYHEKTFLKWQSARHWLSENVKHTVCTERTVWNTEYGYAGTLDAILQMATAQPHRVILDLKTGSPRPVEHRLQLGAYYAALPPDEVDNIDGGILLYAGEKKAKIVELSSSELKREAENFRAIARTYQIFGGRK